MRVLAAACCCCAIAMQPRVPLARTRLVAPPSAIVASEAEALRATPPPPPPPPVVWPSPPSAPPTPAVPPLLVLPKIPKSKIRKGDYIVHADFGVGRFEGVYKMQQWQTNKLTGERTQMKVLKVRFKDNTLDVPPSIAARGAPLPRHTPSHPRLIAAPAAAAPTTAAPATTTITRARAHPSS